MIDKINNDKSKPSDNIDIISSYSRSSSYQYLFKIILIGDSFTGKTSLINRYIHKSFADKYLCTIGVDFTMKAVELTDKTNIKLQIWDTAGMERYKQITTSYYRGAQACIIVFDLTNKYTFENLNKWVGEYNKYHNPLFEKNIILVGNKLDLTEKIAVDREEITSFCKNNDIVYFEASAKNGNNVDDIFFFLANKLFKHYKENFSSQLEEVVQIRNSIKNEKFKNISFSNRNTNNSKKSGSCGC